MKIGRLTRQLAEAVQKKGYKIQSPYFVALFLPSPDSVIRLGVSVSKKELPKAVDRNRAKRRIRNASREIFNHIPVHILIFCKKNCLNEKFLSLKESLKDVMMKFTKLNSIKH